MDSAEEGIGQCNGAVDCTGSKGASYPVGWDSGWRLAIHIWSARDCEECTSGVKTYSQAFLHACPAAPANQLSGHCT
jgi:hypothetical protein